VSPALDSSPCNSAPRTAGEYHLLAPPVSGDPANYRGSHRHLLRVLPHGAAPRMTEARLDAIVVPTSRSLTEAVPGLGLAVRPAVETNSVLLVVCSGTARTRDFPVWGRAQLGSRLVGAACSASPTLGQSPSQHPYQPTAGASATSRWPWPGCPDGRTSSSSTTTSVPHTQAKRSIPNVFRLLRRPCARMNAFEQLDGWPSHFQTTL
jgi:hypothetical protein